MSSAIVVGTTVAGEAAAAVVIADNGFVVYDGGFTLTTSIETERGFHSFRP